MAAVASANSAIGSAQASASAAIKSANDAASMAKGLYSPSSRGFVRS